MSVIIILPPLTYLPRVIWALSGDGPVGQMDPGALAKLLGHAFLVLANPGLFLLEDD